MCARGGGCLQFVTTPRTSLPDLGGGESLQFLTFQPPPLISHTQPGWFGPGWFHQLASLSHSHTWVCGRGGGRGGLPLTSGGSLQIVTNPGTIVTNPTEGPANLYQSLTPQPSPYFAPSHIT